MNIYKYYASLYYLILLFCFQVAACEYPSQTSEQPQYQNRQTNHNNTSSNPTHHVSFKVSRPLLAVNRGQTSGLITTAASQYEYHRYTNSSYPDHYENGHHTLSPIRKSSNFYEGSSLFYQTPSYPNHPSSDTKSNGHLLYDQYTNTNNYQKNITAHQPRNYFRGLATADYYANSAAYSFASRPIKMQREEVIVEHSQLMAIADSGNYSNVNSRNGGTNVVGEAADGGRGGGGLRPHHYTQVIYNLPNLPIMSLFFNRINN